MAQEEQQQHDSASAAPPQVHQVWLDCDPGHDDAMAIILSGHSPGLCQLLGVSTVAGNQELAKVTQNALDVLDAAGLSHVGEPHSC